MTTKIILGGIMGFILAVGVALLIFFTIVKNKMCNGEFVNCPSGNISICAKKGTNAGQFCPKRTGGFKSSMRNNNLRQNNPVVIASDMSNICKNTIKPDSDAVKCALKLSDYENGLQGWPIFGNSTGIDDDMAQDKWCLNLDPELDLNVDLSAYERYRGQCQSN